MTNPFLMYPVRSLMHPVRSLHQVSPLPPSHPPRRARISSAWMIGLVAASLVARFNSAAADEENAASEPLTGHDFVPPAPGTYQLPPIQAAGDGDVLDHNGTPLRLHSLLEGRITVLSFIYTRCGAMRACPYATGVLNELHRTAGAKPELARHLQLITLSFDPENDTPERMASYSRWARERNLPLPWHFLTTRSQRELQPILEAYGQAVDRRRNPDDPLGPLFHTLRVFLIDATGQVRNIYNSDTLDARLVLADIQTLLMESHPS